MLISVYLKMLVQHIFLCIPLISLKYLCIYVRYALMCEATKTMNGNVDNLSLLDLLEILASSD